MVVERLQLIRWQVRREIYEYPKIRVIQQQTNAIGRPARRNVPGAAAVPAALDPLKAGPAGGRVGPLTERNYT
jgi:hypothetical protein